MSATPYFDRLYGKPELQQLLRKLGARPIPGRGDGKTQKVFGLDGGGEALVEVSGSSYRVRLYRGRCAC
jgi:hypothetical protein